MNYDVISENIYHVLMEQAKIMDESLQRDTVKQFQPFQDLLKPINSKIELKLMIADETGKSEGSYSKYLKEPLESLFDDYMRSHLQSLTDSEKSEIINHLNKHLFHIRSEYVFSAFLLNYLTNHSTKSEDEIDDIVFNFNYPTNQFFHYVMNKDSLFAKINMSITKKEDYYVLSLIYIVEGNNTRHFKQISAKIDPKTGNIY